MEEFKKIVKILDKQLKYKGRILSVYNNHVDVSGRETDWDSVEHNGAAAILPILPNGNFLLVKQYRFVVDRYTLEIPAGKVEENEKKYNTLEDEKNMYLNCAKRELEEETGLIASTWEFLMYFNPAMAYCNEKLGIFVAKDFSEGTIHFDIDEETKVEEWNIEDFKKEVFEGRITDSKTIAAVFAYFAKYNK